MTKTQLLYLADFDVLEADATVIDIHTADDGIDLILDRTVFYPGGGGQPADTGELVVSTDTPLPLRQVEMDVHGIVRHRVAASADTVRVGERIHLRVDAAVRTHHCRLHSAGHVIDLAVSNLGYDWTPTKGAHFPGMAFVEYTTNDPLAEDARAQLQAQCDRLIKRGSTNTIVFTDDAGAATSTPSLGHRDSERLVYYDDFGSACGGTHVADIATVGELTINKVKKKKGTIKVSYSLVAS